jgi:hypothetical protein
MNPVVAVALAFTALFGFLTLFVVFSGNFGILEVMSLVVLVLFVFGIFGAFGGSGRG